MRVQDLEVYHTRKKLICKLRCLGFDRKIQLLLYPLSGGKEAKKEGIEHKSGDEIKSRKRKKRKRVTLREKLHFCLHMRAEAMCKQV